MLNRSLHMRRGARRRLRIPIMLAFACVLASCANPFAAHGPTRGSIFAGGWLTEDVSEAQVPVLYCYGTIGVADCHGDALPADEGDRLIGHSGPVTGSSR